MLRMMSLKTTRQSCRLFYVFCLILSNLLFISCGGGGGGSSAPPINPASAKDITAFSIMSVTGTIVGNAISVTVPYGTNRAALVATFTTTGASVRVGATVQVSGGTQNNFNSPVTYIVTAEDASTKSYTVTVTVAPAPTGAIIADHTVVDKFNDIPLRWINEVKKMMVYFPGESHSEAYRTGMELLEAANSTYACNVAIGEAYTDQYVRVNNGGAGEAAWFTWYAYDGHNGANKDAIKNSIKEYADHGHPMHAIGFGWCWDLTRNSPSATADAVYGVHWYGSSEGGPDGDRVWGLDDADYAITGNRVSTDTYLFATEEYRLYALGIGAPTKAIFTTGPADLGGESGYQGHLKHERIRNYVAANSARILFDYADILCYNNAGVQNTGTWNGHTFPTLHADNLTSSSTGHIGSVGAIRLAKAQWWMLARIAGWDGNP